MLRSFVIAVIFFCHLPINSAVAEPPNVLIIIADDCTFNDLQRDLIPTVFAIQPNRMTLPESRNS